MNVTNGKLRRFDLQEALAGKAVMLRDGKKAYVRHHETELKVAKNVCLQGFREDGNHLSWCENGNYHNENKSSFGDIVGMYPETKLINGFEVPAPETEEPAHGTRYYVASPTRPIFRTCETWVGDTLDKIWLKRGLVFLNEDDPVATSKAMLGIEPNSKDEYEDK